MACSIPFPLHPSPPLSLSIPPSVSHLHFLPSNLSLLTPDFLILSLILPGSLPVPMSFVNLHYLPPSIPLPPSRATVGLLDSRSPMLSCSRAKPEQRAHWARRRHNVGRLWQHWRWSHEVAKQLIMTAHPPAAQSVCVQSESDTKSERKWAIMCLRAWLGIYRMQCMSTYLRACEWIKSF